MSEFAKVVDKIDDHLMLMLVGQSKSAEYEYSDLLRLDRVKKDKFRDLEELFWVLMDHATKKEFYLNIPEWYREKMDFKADDGYEINKAKLYAAVRIYADWLEKTWDKDGMPHYVPASTAKGHIDKDQYSNLYDKAYEFFSKGNDMGEFNKQHMEARQKAGKDF